MTTEATIEGLLFQRVGSLVLAPPRRVAWPNQPITPANGETILAVDHLPNRSQRLFIGSSDPHLRQGLLQIRVMGPQNQNAINLTQIAGQVAAWFPTDLRLTSGNVQVRISKAPDIAPGFKDDPHWVVPVSVSYSVHI